MSGNGNGNGSALRLCQRQEYEPGTLETGFHMAGPDGTRVRITRELFLALSSFIGPGKPSGSVTATFRNGGIAGVDSLTRTVYK